MPRSDGNAPPAATLWERPPQQRANIPGAVRGYTSHADKLLRISDGLDDINAARVLLHEAAHVMLHGPDSGLITTEPASRAYRGTAEIRPTAPPTPWPTCSAWTPATLPSATSQAVCILALGVLSLPH